MRIFRLCLLGLILLPGVAWSDPHLYLYHVCGKLAVWEAHSDEASMLGSPEALEHEEVREFLQGVLGMIAPERRVQIDMTPRLVDMFGFRCPAST